MLPISKGGNGRTSGNPSNGFALLTVAKVELAAKVAVSEGVIEIKVCERLWSVGAPLTPGSVEGLILSESWPHCILSFCSKRPVRKRLVVELRKGRDQGSQPKQVTFMYTDSKRAVKTPRKYV